MRLKFYEVLLGAEKGYEGRGKGVMGKAGAHLLLCCVCVC